MKPIVLTPLLFHRADGDAPHVIHWDGVALPGELRSVPPGRYVLLPYRPPPDDPPPPSHLAA